MLKTEFMELYEELSELNEAKTDTQKLIDFAGEDLTNRFLAIKSRLKAPENDLYYWIKNKTLDEFKVFVSGVENVKSNTETKKEIATKGAKLVSETAHWKVYHITTYEAARNYGRDTKWCITGINNYGDKYWKQYSEQGVQFYFFITKGAYDAKGKYSKIALAVYPDQNMYEVFDQQDTSLPSLRSIPFINEIAIPGVDFSKLKTQKEAEQEAINAAYEERVSIDGPNIQPFEYTSYDGGVEGSAKKITGFIKTEDEALIEILNFISGLTREEKANFWLTWSEDYNNFGDFSGDIVVSIQGPSEDEDERILSDNPYAEHCIRRALGLE